MASQQSQFKDMLEDSKAMTQQSFRQAGKKKNGNIQRGFIQNAMLKTSVSSIPSKFETIIYKGNTSKAFGTSASRFHPGEFDKETPAPGYYQELEPQELKKKNISENSSFSKKGFTPGFTSNQVRNTFYQRYINTGPGPGSYNNQNSSKLSLSSQVWSTSNKGSATFQTIGRNLQEKQQMPEIQFEKMEIPGPGEYNPKVNPHAGVNPYHSAFNSRTNRDKYMYRQQTPDPGIYEVRRNIIKPIGYKHGTNSANFCNPVEIKKEANQVKGLMKYLGEEKVVKGTPGPGTYFQEEDKMEEDEKMDDFSKAEKNRFFHYLDLNTKQTNFPGPAHYNTQQSTKLAQIAEETQLVSGAVFMSESIRRPFGDFDKKMGPNNSIPFVYPKKKSFHLNLTKKWV